MGRHRTLLASLLTLSLLLLQLAAQSISVSSSSLLVGATSVNYTFTISNVASVTNVSFAFGNWSYLTQTPFSGSTKCYLNGALVSSSQFPSELVCSMSSTGAATTFNVTLTAMLNPSSSKPYQINATLSNSTTSRTLTGLLTVTTLTNYPLTFLSYSRAVGASSSTIQLDSIMSNYIDPTTFLALNYNTTLINISFPSTSTYTVLQNANGTAIFSTWTNLQSLGGKVVLTNIGITNPLAAISYTITGSFYFRESNVTYNIQTVSVTVTITPAAFSVLTITSPLMYGVLYNLTLTSACNFTQVNGPNATVPAYTFIDYPTQLKPTNASNCAISNSTTCTFARLASPNTITNFQVGVGTFNTSSLTVTTYTYYLGAYYALCRSTASVVVGNQATSPFILTSECNNTASIANSINLYVPMQSAAAGDEAYIVGIKGVVSSSWTKTTINGTITYKYTLVSSNIAANGTVSLPLPYNNPNQTSTNSITALSLYRSGSQYTYMTNSSLALCAITSPRTITTSSIIPTSILTYNTVNISISLTMQIYDYAYGDYMIIQFNSTANAKQYFLAGSLVNLTANLTINGVYCSFSIVNDFTLNVTFGNSLTLPTIASPIMTILLFNLVNPPTVDNYWLSITTYDQPTGGSKETLTSSPLTLQQRSLTYSIPNVYQLKNNTLTLTLTNSNRPILTKNNANAFTTVKVTSPSGWTCFSFTNNTITTIWNVGIITSNGSATGNSTTLTLTLGTCYVPYFSSANSFTITETFSSAASTSTVAALQNICGSTCYECSSSLCTSCFNSTYTTVVFFWNNQCLSGCPNGSFNSNNTCVACHSSCMTCTGSLYTNCTSCSQKFTLASAGYCSSVCGTGKYESGGVCLSCHANCDSCISSTVCYVCKASAVMIGTECQFSSCTSPCSTCLGSLTTCTSCISPKILYQSQCYDSCPAGTYLTKGSCAVFSESSTYIPVTITGVILTTIIIILRAYSSKKIGNESRRRRSYTQEGDVNYKINILRVASVIFGYLEIVAAIVLVLKNGMYGVGSEAMAAVAVGLVFHLFANVAFGVGFVKIVGMRRVSNEEGKGEEEQPSAPSQIRYRVILVLSVLFSFQTYKLLFANLFLDRKNPSLPPRLEDTENPINNIIKAPQSNKIQSTGPPQNRSPLQEIPSRKPIRSNSLGDQNPNPIIQSTASLTIPDNNKQNKFSHPFLTYLTLLALLLGTLPIIIGSILEILKMQFSSMILWGADCLIVSICNIGLTSWDLWIFANLLINQQHSEMSSREQVNHTHENLRQLADLDIKIEPQVKEQKQKVIKSPKKLPISTRGKMSQRAVEKEESLEGVRSGIKRECDQQTVARNDPLPVLKVFDDFDEKDDDILQQKKTKKFSTKNLKKEKKYTSRRTNPNSQRRKNTFGEVCDDLYINFAANERETQLNANSYLQSRPSISPNRSLQEESIEVGGEFEDQPPNFADISDIQQGVVEPINISVASQLAPRVNQEETKLP